MNLYKSCTGECCCQPATTASSCRRVPRTRAMKNFDALIIRFPRKTSWEPGKRLFHFLKLRLLAFLLLILAFHCFSRKQHLETEDSQIKSPQCHPGASLNPHYNAPGHRQWEEFARLGNLLLVTSCLWRQREARRPMSIYARQSDAYYKLQ